MSIELKIKAATLEAEAIIIRQYERKELYKARELEDNAALRQQLLDNPTVEEREQLVKWRERARQARAKYVKIEHHRKTVVRAAARETHLARMFLAGTPYRAVEEKTYTQPRWDRVQSMILRYSDLSPQQVIQQFAEWKSAPCPSLERVVESYYLKEAARLGGQANAT